MKLRLLYGNTNRRVSNNLLVKYLKPASKRYLFSEKELSLMSNSNSTTVSVADNVTELVTFNIPDKALFFDEAKRDEVHALTPDQQILWAKTKMDALRSLAVTAAESVEHANNDVAAFCIALNEVLSGEAWAILGYDTPEACVKEELSLEHLGKIRQARGEVSQILKSVGGFSNRVIATVLGVTHGTINNDFKKMKSVQVDNDYPPEQSTSDFSSAVQLRHNVAAVHSTSASTRQSSFGHGDQKSLSLDGKSYADKRDDVVKMRDFLEFSYWKVLQGKSLREIEQITGTAYVTVKNTLDLSGASEFFHECVTRLFVRARRLELSDQVFTRAAIALQLQITLHGLGFLTSAQGWLAGDCHEHFVSGSSQKLRTPIFCMLDPVSVKAWAASEGQMSRDPLRMNDDERSLTTVSEIAQLLGQQQSNVSYHLDHWKAALIQNESVDQLNAFLEKKKKQHSVSESDTPEDTHAPAASPAGGVSEERAAVDALDVADDWQILLRSDWNNMSLAERMRVLYTQHKRVTPMNLREALDSYSRCAFYLMESDSQLSKSECVMIVDNAVHSSRVLEQVFELIAMVSEFRGSLSETKKQDAVRVLDDLVAAASRVRDCLTATSDDVLFGMSADEYKRELDEQRELDDINDLMRNDWI